jgi:hypothetical protein
VRIDINELEILAPEAAPGARNDGPPAPAAAPPATGAGPRLDEQLRRWHRDHADRTLRLLAD